MIALDTNVLVRWIANDDQPQADAAAKLLGGLSDEDPAFISHVVLAELLWVLGRSLKMPPARLHELVDRLLDTREFEIEDEESVDLALNHARSGADFVDALIAMTSDLYGCTETVTFDRRASQRFGWRLLA